MVLKKLKPGMTVYSVKKATGLHIFNMKWMIYPVHVYEVDIENERVYASWNYNKPEWYYKYNWSKWRLNRPKED